MLFGIIVFLIGAVSTVVFLTQTRMPIYASLIMYPMLIVMMIWGLRLITHNLLFKIRGKIYWMLILNVDVKHYMEWDHSRNERVERHDYKLSGTYHDGYDFQFAYVNLNKLFTSKYKRGKFVRIKVYKKEERLLRGWPTSRPRGMDEWLYRQYLRMLH